MLGKLGKKGAPEVHFSTGVVAEVESGTTIMAASKTVDVEIDSYLIKVAPVVRVKYLFLMVLRKLGANRQLFHPSFGGWEGLVKLCILVNQIFEE